MSKLVNIASAREDLNDDEEGEWGENRAGWQETIEYAVFELLMEKGWPPDA